MSNVMVKVSYQEKTRGKPPGKLLLHHARSLAHLFVYAFAKALVAKLIDQKQLTFTPHGRGRETVKQTSR